ncbi:MAG: winged helix-turn-helix domain-containing protein [Candidatus Gracilibacteria bacterium]|nr:winged helix-turn-helix domain-containing protein [Candidatus Gracilibacteria bacterium]
MEDEERVLLYRNISLDLVSRKALIKGSTISLRNKEYSLLEYFMRNSNRVLTRTRLLEDVWDRNIFCSTNTVDVHVSSLRRKFKKYIKFEIIKTIHCIGYRFGD